MKLVAGTETMGLGTVRTSHRMHLPSTKTTTGSASAHTTIFATSNIYTVTSFRLEYMVVVHTIFRRNRVRQTGSRYCGVFYTKTSNSSDVASSEVGCVW